MGYMGLDCVEDSDMAAGLAFNVWKRAAATLTKGLKARGNEFNTSGPVDVALFYEQYLLPIARDLRNCDELTDLANKTEDALEKLIADSKKADWGDATNKKWHIASYQRMLRKIRKYLRIVYRD